MALKNLWKLNISAWLRAVFAVVLGLYSCWVVALPTDLYSFANQADQQRFVNLTKELRCLVCLNQSLADSDAPLAKDLRDKIVALVNAHKTDAEIRAYLVSRYGEFILFSPPVKQETWLLWGFPGLLLLGVFGGLVFWRRCIV